MFEGMRYEHERKACYCKEQGRKTCQEHKREYAVGGFHNVHVPHMNEALRVCITCIASE